MEVSGQPTLCLCRFTPVKEPPDTHWVGGWVSPDKFWTFRKRKVFAPARIRTPDHPARSLFTTLSQVQWPSSGNNVNRACRKQCHVKCKEILKRGFMRIVNHLPSNTLSAGIHFQCAMLVIKIVQYIIQSLPLVKDCTCRARLTRNTICQTLRVTASSVSE